MRSSFISVIRESDVVEGREGSKSGLMKLKEKERGNGVHDGAGLLGKCKDTIWAEPRIEF